MGQIPVIFIDANTTFRRLIVRVLEQHFADMIAFVSDADSWSLARSSVVAPRAVLLGLGAEGLVDPQLLATIHIALPYVPIIVLGHLDDAAYRDAALAAGAAAFISKDDLGVELIPVLRRLTHSGNGVYLEHSTEELR